MPSLIRGTAAFTLIALLLGSCSSDDNNNPTKTMSKVAGDNQSATVSTAVATRPAVKIVDQNNAGVSGVSVTFAVASGGGSITGASATTGNDGIATVGSWTLGATAGSNTLTATASGVTGSPVTFTATATAVGAPVPTAMTKVAGTDAQTATVGASVANAPAVKVVDAGGVGVPNVAVTFAVATGGGSVTGGSATTNSQGIATVGSWTLGATAGANTLTATAAGSGISGNPATFTATGTLSAFSPTGNVSLSGTQTFSSVNIPAGVTVTLTGDATINVSGPVTLNGSIVGNCVNLTISATGALTSNGTINTSCTTIPGAGAPSLTLISNGGYNISGGTITASGNVRITNDATLTDATFAAPPAPQGLRSNLKQIGVCIVQNAAFNAAPANATAGINGQFGTKGADASQFTLECTGELDMQGGITVTGQNGGAGGTGTHSSGAAALATGGQGGLGGNIRVRASNGDLVFNGAGNVVRSGNGGAGGAATATGNNGSSASASATGGAGNQPGNIILQAKGGGVSIGAGSVTLTMGNGGVGGAATATGGTPADAPPCPNGNGGAATAVGGVGGNTPDKTLTATGQVVGAANVTVNGGNPGAGGAALATGGQGSAGAQPCKPGGAGGAMSATGGNGGNALIKNGLGALIANGGNGGSMEDAAGNGGQGWSDCRTVLEAGGVGGAGGAASGRNGTGGTGLAAGTPGSAKFTLNSNGGNGGDGSGPGAGGAAGGSNANITVVATTVQPNFTAGLPGAPCHPTLKLRIAEINNNGGQVAPGTQNIGVNDGSTGLQVPGTTISYVTTGVTFVSTSNNPEPRSGWAPNSGHVGVGVTPLQVNGKTWQMTKANVCVVNAPNVSAGNPITVQPKNAAGAATGAPQTITSQTCQDVTWPSDAVIIDLFGPVGADVFFMLFGHAPD